MTKFLRHLKANAVAYLALFVALGGTSYAALRIPAGSVGASQLKNHSIAPIKFDRSQIGAYVRYWAEIGPGGKVLASRPNAHLIGWSGFGGTVSWNRSLPAKCFALANAEAASPTPAYASTSTATSSGRNGSGVGVVLSEPSTFVQVALVCPQP